MQALAELAVEGEKWDEAQQLAAHHPDVSQAVFLPWAEWLVSRGSFQEARLAYRYCLWPTVSCSNMTQPSSSVLPQCQVQLDIGQAVANSTLLLSLLARLENSRSNAWLPHSSS